MNVGGNVYRIVDGTLDLADLGVLDGLKGLESLQGLEGLKSVESLKSLKSLKGLKNLKDLGKLKVSEYLKKQMDADSWKRFEESMEMLEKRLEDLE